MTSPDATLAVVQEQVDALNVRNDERFTQFRQILKDANFRTVVVNLHDDLVRDIKAALYLLWGGVLFVLVIGCVNLANLMMVRSARRSREMATRHAIGGELGRLARQLLTETTVLSIVGGMAGVLLAWWGTRSVASLNLDQLPRGYEIQLDWLGLAFRDGDHRPRRSHPRRGAGRAAALHESERGAARGKPRRDQRPAWRSRSAGCWPWRRSRSRRSC